MSVLLTDGDQRATLAVVRALGAAGIGVTVGHHSERSLAGSSKYALLSFRYPSPTLEPKDFVSCISRELRTGSYRMLLPMTDVTMLALYEYAHLLPSNVNIPFPKLEVVRLAQDKARIMDVAVDVGIGTPATFQIRSDEDLHRLAESLMFPLVIKPRVSRYFSGGKWHSGLVSYAVNGADLLEKYRAAHAVIPLPLVQETIQGDGRGVFLLIWNGELKAAFCHRRLREKPPWGGISVLRESAPPDKELIEKSFALLRAINWNGVAMVEFKNDDRDGMPKLMEVNGRFWGSLQLAIDAGMNLPLMLYRLATGESVPNQLDYKVGVRSRWLLGDLDSLLITLRNGNNGLVRSYSPRLRACFEFAKFWQPNTRYEIFKLHDPAPGVFECKQYIRDNVLGLHAAVRSGS